MSTFYFFTEIDKLEPQSAGFAYGPVADPSNDKYRVTNFFTSNNTGVKAFSVTSGTILVQADSTNSNLVNLILKPFVQPASLNVKISYYIYRGIKKSSLLSGNYIAVSATNRLTESIWTSHTDRRNHIIEYNEENDLDLEVPEETPPAGAIGIDFTAPTYENSDLLDKIFLQKNSSFQLPVVQAGWHIGEFDSTKFGFEIITESLSSPVTIGLTRLNENMISVPTLAGTETHAQQFEHWHKKEQILNYIDAAAFWGSFYTSKLKVARSSGMEVLKGAEVYNVLLNKFYNKNTVYLDIRNDKNYSYDYFQNYGRNIQIAYDDSTTFTSVSYYVNKWPIVIFNNSNFTSVNGVKKKVFKIKLASGDNPKPLIYVKNGLINSGEFDSDLPVEPEGKDRFIDIEHEEDFTHTNILEIAVPNLEGASGTVLVSTLVILKYLKQDYEVEYPSESSDRVIRSSFYLDNIFPIFNLANALVEDSSYSTFVKVFHDEVYIDDLSLLNWDFIGSLGIVKQKNALDPTASSYTFFTVPDKINNYHSTVVPNILPVLTDKRNIEDNWFDSNYESTTSYLRSSEFVLEGERIPYIEFEENNVNSFFGQSSTDILSITISDSDFQDLLSLLNSSDFSVQYPVYLGLKLIEDSYDLNSQNYRKYLITLTGYHVNDNEIEVKQVESTIFAFIYGVN